MTDQIRKQIGAYVNRLARYPDHTNREFMENEIKRLNSELQQPPAPPADRLLERSERIINAIRRAKQHIIDEPDSEKSKRLAARIVEWQTSLTNIKEYGTENPKQSQIVGTTISIPADVMEVSNKKVAANGND